jgi:hypothetical protein
MTSVLPDASVDVRLAFGLEKPGRRRTGRLLRLAESGTHIFGIAWTAVDAMGVKE